MMEGGLSKKIEVKSIDNPENKSSVPQLFYGRIEKIADKLNELLFDADIPQNKNHKNDSARMEVIENNGKNDISEEKTSKSEQGNISLRTNEWLNRLFSSDVALNKDDAGENVVKDSKESVVEKNQYMLEKTNIKEGLTNIEKRIIRKEKGWSDEIIDNIRSMEEYEIYKKAGLQETEIGGKIALIRNDIDWEQVDEKGKTNTERIQRGLSPLDKEGNPIQLHHIGQHSDSPLAELTFKEHRCDGNDTILHDKKKETETHGEGNDWDNERQNYWKDRAEHNKGGSN